ncbi:ATP-binding protein [Daejeonella sp. JGW-45]|uniref:ATP-binding protein n=1 Tax=Daejeonella sp. JGW-45 TaxID=3034148 RepID=UPI0023ECE569|nr:ATP-binding protein [Daejeonella sp. JGW-45]
MNENEHIKTDDQPSRDEILQREIDANGGEWKDDPNCVGAAGMTMFDSSSSQDNLITVLLPKQNVRTIGAHSLVEIRSRTDQNGGDGRKYRGIVVAGPFHEPDGIKADAPMIITTTIHGAIFMPNFHGKVYVELIGELKDGAVVPPKFRPLPNSPVFVLSNDETGAALNVAADPGITMGMAIGHDNIEVQIPSDKKTVLPRHIGILGTTGGGKSTTVSGLMAQFQQKNVATIVIDTEGEYTQVDRPAENANMKKILEKREIANQGIKNIKVFSLIGRDTRAEKPTAIASFTIKFSRLSPYAAVDIMGLTEAQFGRFFKAYDAAKKILKELQIYPKKGQERESLEIDELETGYPELTLTLLIDVAGLILNQVAKDTSSIIRTSFMKEDGRNPKIDVIIETVAKSTDNDSSWKALLGKLWQLDRTKVFDQNGAYEIPFEELIKPGVVSIIDLHDSDSSIVNNIVIATLLRGVQRAQEEAYEKAIEEKRNPTPVSIIIEEAHEFLSRERIAKMSNLFEQVARIARRGRKRWLGLVFVTQLPQHLPDEVLGLINSFILHKINDAAVISRLKRSIGGVDDNLWNRLPSLAPGQAVVSTPSLTRPLLVAMDPSPCKLLLVE